MAYTFVLNFVFLSQGKIIFQKVYSRLNPYNDGRVEGHYGLSRNPFPTCRNLRTMSNLEILGQFLRRSRKIFFRRFMRITSSVFSKVKKFE